MIQNATRVQGAEEGEERRARLPRRQERKVAACVEFDERPAQEEYRHDTHENSDGHSPTRRAKSSTCEDEDVIPSAAIIKFPKVRNKAARDGINYRPDRWPLPVLPGDLERPCYHETACDARQRGDHGSLAWRQRLGQRLEPFKYGDVDELNKEGEADEEAHEHYEKYEMSQLVYDPYEPSQTPGFPRVEIH